MGFILTFFAKNIDMSTMVKTEVFLGYLLEMLGSELHIFTARKRNLGQCNVFTPVCQSFCSQGGVCIQRGRSASGRGVCIQWGGGAKIPTSWILRDTVNEWVVRILLECILLPIFGRLTTQWSVRLHCSFVSTLAALLTLQSGIVPHFLEQIARNINWKSITDTSVDGRC